MCHRMHLQYIERFQNSIFPSAYSQLLNSDVFTKYIESIRRTRSICDVACLVMHGTDNMVLEQCVNVLLQTITQSDTMPTCIKREANASQFPHLWHNHFIIVDVIAMLADDREKFILHAKQLSKHECVVEPIKRHIIVIRNAQAMTSIMAHAMRSAIDSGTCYIVFMTKNVCMMDKNIMSRCMTMNCSMNVLHCHETILKLLGVDVYGNALQKALAKSKGNITKFLIILERNHASFLLDAFLENRMTQLLQSAPEQRICIVSDTAERIETSGIRPAAVCSILIDVCQKLLNDDGINCIHDVIQLLSEMQVKIMESNKYSYILEVLLYSLVDLMSRNTNIFSST